MCPLVDKEQVDDALNISDSKMADHHLESHGSVAGRVMAMNCWGGGVSSMVKKALTIAGQQSLHQHTAFC